jgi:hypothetical protein
VKETISTLLLLVVGLFSLFSATACVYLQSSCESPPNSDPMRHTLQEKSTFSGIRGFDCIRPFQLPGIPDLPTLVLLAG